MKFEVILADPSWPYRNVRTGGSHKSGSAQVYATAAHGHGGVMTLDEIAAMPVKQLAAKNAVCFLWATTPLGTDPYRVLAAWGFDFKTKWYWRKTGRLGLGYWTRGCVEEVLIGIRGTVPAWRSSLENWIEAPEEPLVVNYGGVVAATQQFTGVFESKPEGHSRKPLGVRTMIEALTPGTNRVELFSTQAEVPHWTHYGLQIDPSHDFRDPAFWARVAAEEPVPA